MTDSRRPVADVHIADWFLAALDAVEPVLMVIGTSVKFFRVFIQGWVRSSSGLDSITPRLTWMAPFSPSKVAPPLNFPVTLLHRTTMPEA